jgi:hypothetical protein
MPSELIERARTIIKTYPEVFDSLLEFEETKKIPKLYRRRRVNLTIDENILREFKAYSNKRAINMSRFVEQHMINSMKNKEPNDIKTP